MNLKLNKFSIIPQSFDQQDTHRHLKQTSERGCIDRFLVPFNVDEEDNPSLLFALTVFLLPTHMNTHTSWMCLHQERFLVYLQLKLEVKMGTGTI